MPRAVVVAREDMLRYHDPVRIKGYCQSCEKYGKYWSCPPFENDPLARLPAWSHAVLVTQKTWVGDGTNRDGLIDLFLTSRQAFVDMMRQRETLSPGAFSVVAGHCSDCTVCTRPRGVTCCAPSRLRYSLEGLGFDVTGLSEGLAGQAIQWPSSGMPDYLITVGALLCRDRQQADLLCESMNGTTHR